MYNCPLDFFFPHKLGILYHFGFGLDIGYRKGKCMCILIDRNQAERYKGEGWGPLEQARWERRP